MPVNDGLENDPTLDFLVHATGCSPAEECLCDFEGRDRAIDHYRKVLEGRDTAQREAAFFRGAFKEMCNHASKHAYIKGARFRDLQNPAGAGVILQPEQEPGLVKYLGATSGQATWAGATDPRDFLVVGAKYMVKRIEVHSQHTRVYLTDFPGVWFNLVCFVEEGKDDD